ncbi:neuronal PAS domain-containing protein 4B [Electrophorus electricus]|uniref:neuronal PAS domain-containing protein 4B n=1 Tax=Electrophorus electricus TaxID=8005 RepID=UPI0015D0ACBF|nr:neuronal PAS domain-containing protein 4B [Electrophorus electricus]
MYRSTKGASKARRDQINAEIRNLKDLLPISDADKSRLSYLHIMSLACMYTRKSVFFTQELTVAEHHDVSGTYKTLSELSELVHTLPGFLLLLTSEGKLLYLSDNVAEHLGHSMVDLVAQSDSVYDIIDPADHFIMRSNLVPATTIDTEHLFRCRFNTSKFVRRQGSGNRMSLVRARCLPSPYHASSYWTSNAVWMCFCSPLEPQTPHPSTSRNPLPTPPAEQAFLLACFQSQHSRDMRLQVAQECVSVYLGYDVETLRSRSWYSFLHPRDLAHASTQHCTLLREEGERQVEMVVQVETADHSWVWLYMILQLKSGEHPISCQNYVISESEAWSVRQQLYTEQSQLALLYQEPLAQQCSEPLSSPEQVFTPSSSGLSAQSFDFSFTTSGRSSSEELPSTPAQSNLSLGSAPCPTSSLDEDSFSQQHASHQTWLQEAKKLTTTTAPTAPPSQLTDISSMARLCSAGKSHAPPALVPNPSIPKQHSLGELVCTPPYTPRLGGGCFTFGEELFNPDSVTTLIGIPCRINQVTSSANQLMSLSTGTGITLSVQHCCKPLFEKLPPTPDSPDNDKSILMALPQIRGPLYVDVPHSVYHSAPEGLLTPEASPTEQLCPGFFSQQAEDEQERLEISLLAQYLSSVAEGFCHDRPLTTRTPSPVLLQEPISIQSGVASSCEFPPTMCWREAHSSLAQDEISLFQGSLLPAVPLSASSSSSSSSSSPSLPSPHSSIQHPPPPGPTQEEALVGVHHLCSVQSTHHNSMTGARLLESGALDEAKEITESRMDMEMLPPAQSSTLSASPEATPGSVLPDVTPGLPCAQSLLEELATMEPVFEAAASITPALRQQTELYQLSFQESPQHFYQDGTGDHMF